MLPHSLEPGRAYSELARLGSELATAGETLARTSPDFDIALLYDSDSKFALSAQATFSAPGQYFDPDSYGRIFASFYRGAFDAGAQVRMVRPQQLFPERGGAESAAEFAASHPILVVAAFFTASDAELDWLHDYAEAGGHLVLGPRSAYSDREGRARRDVKPARLAETAGAWYDEFANLREPIAAIANGIPLLPGSAGTDWVDALNPTTADDLVRYDHPHFGRWAAVTSRAVGEGTITLVGTLPNQALAESIVRWLVPVPVAGWETPPTVTVSTSSSASERVHIVHNWSWDPTEAGAPTDLVDLLDGTSIAKGESLGLSAWDVRVFAEEKRITND